MTMFSRYKPETLKVYLASTATFVQFLSASEKWMGFLSMNTAKLQTIEAKLKEMASSLKKDILEEAVRR